jgi:hypothetical protein
MLKKLKMIPCCVTPEQHAALKALSKRAGGALQQYLREAVTDVLEKYAKADEGYITAKPEDRFFIRNHRHWAGHYQAMANGVEVQLMMPECSTPPEETAALERVLKLFEEQRDHHIAADLALTQPGTPPTTPSYTTEPPRTETPSGYITEPPKPKAKAKRGAKGKPPLTAEQIAAFDAVWYEPKDFSELATRSRQVDAMRATGWRPPHERERRERAAWRREHSAELDATKAAGKAARALSRRRRMKELHPDKQGRDQTPAERAEFTKLAKQGRQRKR